MYIYYLNTFFSSSIVYIRYGTLRTVRALANARLFSDLSQNFRQGADKSRTAARDVDSKELLTFRCSFTRSSLDAEILLKDVLQYCTDRPLFLVDRGPWYPDAFKNLDLEHQHQTFGMRNRIERWFRDTEDQAKGVLQ